MVLKNCYRVVQLALEDLVLDRCFLVSSKKSLKLNISVATLKRLTITFIYGLINKLAFELVIDSPALIHLSSILPRDYSLVLVATESLEKVDIVANANAREMLRGVKNIQSLQLPNSIMQGLDHDHILHLPLYDKLTYLKICYWDCLTDIRSLEYLLARCIVLETLVFEQHEEGSLARTTTTSLPHLLLQSQLTGLLCHLKRIEINVFKVDDAKALLGIIKFFLKNAMVLEKLIVSVRQACPEQLSKIEQVLLRLPRVSEKCQVFVNRLSYLLIFWSELAD